MSRENTEVLVVGAGPVGLAAAIELGQRGIRVVIVDRNARGGQAPRAKTTNVRTRTIMRRWGIAHRLAEESPLGIEYPYDVAFTTRLGGHLLARFTNCNCAAPIAYPDFPEHAQWIPQYTLEKVLREEVARLKTVDLRFGVTFTGAAQDAEGCTSTLEGDAGEILTVTSRYIVGADGSRSTVRDIIGANMVGERGLSRNYNVIFRAPGLAEAHPHGKAVMYWQTSADGASLLGPMDRDDVWFFMPTAVAEGKQLSSQEAEALIARSTGIDLPYEVLSTDEWYANELLADKFQEGRIFLAGDACHLHPPFGGYGMNMGVVNAVDIGWKIAAVLQGWGAPALLESYGVERRQSDAAMVAAAVVNHTVLPNSLSREGIEDDTPQGSALRKQVGEYILRAKAPEFHGLGTVLGIGYEDSPINAKEAAPPAPREHGVYHPTARPGHLAPHCWLEDGRSLYDLFGKGFTLVADAAAPAEEIAKAVAEGKALGAPLDVAQVKDAPIDRLYCATLALVRPDQYVAWRGDAWIPGALAHAIGRGSASAAEQAA